MFSLGCLRSVLPKLGLGGLRFSIPCSSKLAVSGRRRSPFLPPLVSLGETTSSKPSDVDTKTRLLSLWNGNRKVAAE